MTTLRNQHDDAFLQVQLRPGDALGIRAYGPLKLATIDGCAWVTEDRQVRDLVQNAGEEHAWEKCHRIIVCALERRNCTIRIHTRRGDRYFVDLMGLAGDAPLWMGTPLRKSAPALGVSALKRSIDRCLRHLRWAHSA